MSSPAITDLREIDSVLGTPSAQVILRVFVVWEKLQKKQIMTKTGLSETQVYNTVHKLVKIGILEQEGRGLYRLGASQFTKNLQLAYSEKLKQIVGNYLNFLTKNIDSAPLSEMLDIYKFIVDQWHPLLQKEFPAKLSALAGHLLDKEDDK